MGERQPNGCRYIYKDGDSSRRPQSASGSLSELVTSVLLHAWSVAANPSPSDVVAPTFAQQRFPQILICNRDAAGTDPRIPNPARYVLCHSSLNVLTSQCTTPDGGRFLQS